jgi:hypothetical protein
MPGTKLLSLVQSPDFGSDHLAFLLSEEFGKTGAVKLGIDIAPTRDRITKRSTDRELSTRPDRLLRVPIFALECAQLPVH